MKVKVCRTSGDWVNATQPIPEAYVEKNKWFINIEPGEIFELVKKYGSIIIYENENQNGFTLEIYDDYRE